MKMQPYKFRDVEEMLDSLPKEERTITEFLRSLVLDTLPQAKEKLSFNVPFYSLRKNVCHIWPGSVAWGKKTYEGVSFGFTYGSLLLDETNYLDKGTRKQIYSKKFLSLSEIDVTLLKSYIFESALIDEEVYQSKKLKD
ncbi:DUF1801 domain-containing protein [Arcticibacterium luteifluviistationis]|uniref:DUF1801 domain-containing protein n=2 Tax=Arcticibacterium luteifluviistationis TaxID=1784714 RepID=A0A2Z4GHF9_9BACT|nr:DUF1801 domain-containing protein [Arcticibacterium luteifluviistationis]